MHLSQRVETFTNRHPLVGPAFYWVSIQYFVTQLIVALAWTMPAYDFFKYAISDLGNTACELYDDRVVCSPYHTWMNASFVVLGLTMIAGSALIYQMFKKNSGSLVGFCFMALAGLGTVLVGLFPENTVAELHTLGAGLAFLIGNLALIILGLSLDLPKLFRYYTLLSGIVALFALILLVTENYLGLGFGGMERLTAHPQTVWLILFGIYISRNRFKIIDATTGH